MNLIIIFAGLYLHFVVIFTAALVFLIEKSSIRRDIFKLGALSLPFAYITAKILGHLIYNPRPFVVEHTMPLIPHAANNGFPSDHTLLAITIAAVFFTFDRKAGSLLIILGLALAVARILARVHYPIDILGSIAIALATTYICQLILNSHKPTNSFLDKVLKTLKI